MTCQRFLRLMADEMEREVNTGISSSVCVLNPAPCLAAPHVKSWTVGGMWLLVCIAARHTVRDESESKDTLLTLVPLVIGWCALTRSECGHA